MIEKIDRIVYTIIHMPNYTENKKKSLLVKLVHSPSLKNGGTLEQSDVVAVFDTCISIITTEDNEGAAQLAVFAFNTWAGQHKNYLKEYLTPEKVSYILSGQTNNVMVIGWLKETLCHLIKDADTICTLGPILDGVLQTKLRDFGGNSAFVAVLADLYAACPAVLPQPHTRLTFTVTLMNCVASFPTPTKTEVVGHMKSIGGLINMLWNGLRLEDILYSLHAMYAIISNADGGSEVCPAMAHLLSLVPTVVVEALAPRIVADPSTTDVALNATLTRLTAWLVLWPIAHQTLGLWVRTLVRLLYQNGRMSVPTKVTLERVPKLLTAMHIPVVRNGIVSVISTLLLSLQHSPVAFHKIIMPLLEVFGRLERECSDNARMTLNHLATLVFTLMALHPGYPQTYQPLMDVLIKYEAPSDKDIHEMIQEHAWASGEGTRNYFSQVGTAIGMDTSAYQQRTLSQRVGLRNLGNTCYMNSVIQALFMTDSFRHQILHAVPRSNQQLLVKLQQLFSLLCFTNRTYVAPRIFHDKSRPPWFSPGMQQDCSEYLRYLMITLHEEERSGQRLPEYQERIIIESETASLASDFQPLPYDSASEDFNDAEQPLKVDFCPETNSVLKSIHAHKSMSSSEMDVEMDSSGIENCADKSKSAMDCNNITEQFKGNLADSSGELTTEYNNEQDRKSRLLVSSNIDISETRKVLKSPEEGYDILENSFDNEETLSRHPDDASKSSHCKRKHNVNRGASQSVTKSSKVEMMTSDIDNSSDSGISGDLAEDTELRSPSASSPSPKDSSILSNKDLNVEEIVTENSNIEGVDSEYFVSLVHKVFGGKLATRIKCLQCKTESVHKDVFTDIHLAFQDADRYNATTAIRRNPERVCRQKQQDNPVDLKIEDMITSYLTSEILTGENQYECDRCCGKQDAERSIQILEPPEHLILTQLRFYYDTTKGQRQKVFTNVEFGEELLLPIKYSMQGILSDNFSLSQGKGASLQGYFSGKDVTVNDVSTSKSNLSDYISASSGSTSKKQEVETVDISCKCKQLINSNGPKKTTCNYLNSAVKNFESAWQHNCSTSQENSINSNAKVLAKHPSGANTMPHIDAGGSSSLSCDVYPSSHANAMHDDLHYSDSQPSCSSTGIMNYVPERVSDDFINSSEESSGCMTPEGRCHVEQEVTYARYALYGVVVHSGFSSEGGHYYCYARNSSIAALPESVRERYGALGYWYNFNDEKVTNTSFSAINSLTRTFSRDTAYQLFYKKLSESLAPDVPLFEDMKSLRLDLRETVECDNLQYRSEQDREAQRKRSPSTGGSHFPRDTDHDGTPPPGGCGGGPGGGGFNTPSRVVF
ncbi:ubiquitin carboxyl-terminal hydrolase 38-like isoform X1 [Macrobrachium rosenbergii]|uniref:ubiquitin carboxyl-terminal hydrolase 38-like isoform X1 n=1 Tax=Macrobrachium rosenbergii TaxID=79674 RepID=UPI0034D63973